MLDEPSESIKFNINIESMQTKRNVQQRQSEQRVAEDLNVVKLRHWDSCVSAHV